MNKLSLMVCPHDTAKRPERWFAFAQYLARKLEEPRVVFSPSLGFEDFHQRMASADLIYANPQDTHHLCRERGYQPIARAANLFDEVVIIANQGMVESAPNLSVAALEGRTVASVPSMLPTCLALERLGARGIRPAAVLARDSWLAVMNAVLRKEAPFGFVYKDFFDGLSRLGKRMMRVLDESDDGCIHHSFVLAPGLEGDCQRIADRLFGMHEDHGGRAVLDALDMTRLVPVHASILDKVTALRAVCDRAVQ